VKSTFVDAGVLIAAARGGSEQSRRAMAILDDPEREFVASPFLRLEVLPQALFNKRHAEVAFYEAFFSAVTRWTTDLAGIVEAAQREASTCGVEAMDALHVAAAASAGAIELVTTEKPTRSIHRARLVRITTIHPEGD
jgi:predicted nucleic acid-binding protein